MYPHMPLSLRQAHSRALRRVADVGAPSRPTRAVGEAARSNRLHLVRAPRPLHRRMQRRHPVRSALPHTFWPRCVCATRTAALPLVFVADGKSLPRPPLAAQAAVPTAAASAASKATAASAPGNAWSSGNLAKDMAKTQQEEAEKAHRVQQQALAAQQQFASPVQSSPQAAAPAGRGQSAGVPRVRGRGGESHPFSSHMHEAARYAQGVRCALPRRPRAGPRPGARARR